MQTNDLYSIIIPVYKSVESLYRLQERIADVFAKMPLYDYEIIFVNDSPFHRETTLALSEIAYASKKVTVIELTKNFGQQAATMCGMEYASGDFIITMDDDLQHAPEDIPKIIELNTHDVVIARFKNNKHNFFKRMTSVIKAYFDYIILGKPKNIRLSPFRMIKSDVSKWMIERKTPFLFLPALMFSVTDDIVNVELDHYERYEGKSNYTLFKMLKLFSNLIINNSSFLLRGIGLIGIVMAIASFILGAVIVYKKLVYDTAVVGWSSIFVAILLFGGMILFALGIIGEYLIRIIAISERRPIFIVRQVLNGSTDECKGIDAAE